MEFSVYSKQAINLFWNPSREYKTGNKPTLGTPPGSVKQGITHPGNPSRECKTGNNHPENPSREYKPGV